MKACVKCGRVFDGTEGFYVKGRRRDGSARRGSECKECSKAYVRQWKLDRPDHGDNDQLLRKYDLSLDAKKKMLAQQGGVCAVCRRPLGMRREGKNNDSALVDHKHGSKIVRGVLCHACNTGLGYFKDSHELLEEAARYLIAAPLRSIRQIQRVDQRKRLFQKMEGRA